MIPKNHPRYQSLLLRDKIKNAFKEGYLADSGMIAHGRGETFDYLLGEKTTPPAKEAMKVAVSKLLLAKNPVLSVNGNTTALAIDEVIDLAKELNAKIEINLFYRTEERVNIISKMFKEHGWENILGDNTEELLNIDGITNPRSTAAPTGIYTADLVLVPLEDGDRAEILIKHDKEIITIDLNPLSRTAQMSTVTIVDNIVRALPYMTKIAKDYKTKDKKELETIINNFNNKENINKSLNEFKIKEIKD
jgi:4-phosphopantoate--beta-alanine ligase